MGGRQDLLGGAEALDPLEALLLLDGQATDLLVALVAELLADPEVQVRQAQQLPREVHQQRGMQVEALGLVGVVEEAQAGGSAQVGEVEAGAVVDVHDRVAPAGGAGGRQGERGQEVVDGGLRVRQEAVGALGGRPVATGLRQGAPQVAFQVGQNQRQTDAQMRLSEARGLDVGRHGKTGEDHAKLRSRRTPFLLAYPSANASTSPCVRVSPQRGEGRKALALLRAAQRGLG